MRERFLSRTLRAVRSTASFSTESNLQRHIVTTRTHVKALDPIIFPALPRSAKGAERPGGGRHRAVAEASAPLPVQLKVTDTHPSLAPDKGTPDTTALPLK